MTNMGTRLGIGIGIGSQTIVSGQVIPALSGFSTGFSNGYK